jgi:hypothetical protein
MFRAFYEMWSGKKTQTLHFQLDEFVNKFETEGPGIEENMDKGQKLMEMYAVEFEKLEATRVEMGELNERQHTVFFLLPFAV